MLDIYTYSFYFSVEAMVLTLKPINNCSYYVPNNKKKRFLLTFQPADRILKQKMAIKNSRVNVIQGGFLFAGAISF